MNKAKIQVKKGSIFAYRVYDIAHEIDLKKAEAALNQVEGTVKRFSLQRDPHRMIIMRQAPVHIQVSGVEEIKIKLPTEEKTLQATLEIKLWDYGVISFCYRINTPENLSWKDLVLIGSILDTDSVIDELCSKKRQEVTKKILPALKNPYQNDNQLIFEDYTTYLVQEAIELVKTKNDKEEESLTEVAIKNPQDLLKKAAVAELILAEPNRSLSDNVKKTVLSNGSQYTNKDLLILDWNSALVIDFTKEKEYQDYVDLIEFSLTQLLELRIYDQLLDEKLDSLYDAIENKSQEKMTNYYSSLSEEASQLYMEFSDFFEKLDNSLKTVGDVYLAKVLDNADKKFGFEKLKKTMSRKIDTLGNITEIFQDKINGVIDEERNKISEQHQKTTLRLEWAVVIFFLIEVGPTIWKFLTTTLPNFISGLM